jgi:hypothetical protein
MSADSITLAGAPGRIRTYDLRIRSPSLCPLSYGRLKPPPTAGAKIGVNEGTRTPDPQGHNLVL